MENQDKQNETFYEEMNKNITFKNASELTHFLRLALSKDDTYTSSIYFARQMVSSEGLFLQNLPKFQDDEDIVFLAVNQDGSALQFRSERLKKDRRIALKRVSNNGIIYRSLDESLKRDPEIAKSAVSRFGEIFKFIPEDLKRNDLIIKSAIKNYPYAINEVPNYIRNKYTELFIASMEDYEEKILQESKKNKRTEELHYEFN